MNHTKTSDQVSDALSSIPLSVQLKAKWHEIRLEENYIPKVEMPEMCFKDHIIGMAGRHLNCELKIDGIVKKYRLLAGELLIMPAKQVFTLNFDRGHVSKAIHLSHKLLKRNALELWDTDKFELTLSNQVHDPLLTNIQKSLCIEFRKNPDNCDIYVQTMTNALAVHLLTRYSTYTKPTKMYAGGLSLKKLKLVIEFINENLGQELSLDDLASLVHLSQYHFARAFKQSLGVSPHQYVIQQRVERAKMLIKQGNMSISAVSIVCGFTHQSHLNRHFKRLTGMTPKVFQNS